MFARLSGGFCAAAATCAAACAAACSAASCAAACAAASFAAARAAARAAAACAAACAAAAAASDVLVWRFFGSGAAGWACSTTAGCSITACCSAATAAVAWRVVGFRTTRVDIARWQRATCAGRKSLQKGRRIAAAALKCRGPTRLRLRRPSGFRRGTRSGATSATGSRGS